MSQIYLLKGKIVTMTGEANVLDGGYICVKDNTIEGVYPAGGLPASLNAVPVTDTKGVIYPGLMDLHNHFVYDVLPLWVVPKKYDNRSQWPTNADYQAGVSEPIKQVLAKYSESSKAIVRYIEAKAMMGGTTTGQGIRTQVNGSVKLFDGAMRNVEEPGSSGLPAAGTLVPDLFVGGTSGPANIAAFKKAINRPGQVAYFYHLAEGVDAVARQHFLDLKDNDLIDDQLVGIHCLGLQPADLAYFVSKGGKVVWSPFSNQLLYGQTLDLRSLKASGALFSIGCDWTPTGSKNLLEELKVASWSNQQQGDIFTNYELIIAVTASPAKILGWDQHLGTIEAGKLADLVVVADHNADVYQNLILAVEDRIGLVIIDGVPRYGDTALMKSLPSDPANPAESITVNTIQKSLYLYSDGSEINDLKFSDAQSDLTTIMSDLATFVNRMGQQSTLKMHNMEALPNNDFQLVLDNEFDVPEAPLKINHHEMGMISLTKPPMQNSITIDTPFASGTDYWTRVSKEKNIPPALIDWLKQCYQV